MVPMAAFIAERPRQPAVDERQQRRAEGPAGGGLGRRRQAAEDGAEREADQRAQRHDAEHDRAEIGVAEVGEHHEQPQDRRESREVQRANADRQARSPRLAEQQVREQIGHDDEAEETQGDHGDAHLLRGHCVVGVPALIHRHRRAELRIDEAADQRVGDVAAREQEARPERRRIEQVDRHAHGRAHHHQHDARRDQDAERAAGGDGAGRQPRVVAGLDHDRPGHDAEHGHGRADDAGRHGEDGRREDDRQVERAAHRRQQVAQRHEQPLHRARPARSCSP